MLPAYHHPLLTCLEKLCFKDEIGQKLRQIRRSHDFTAFDRNILMGKLTNWTIELQILSYDEEVKFMDIWFYPTVEASERTLQPSNGIAAAASSSSIL